MRHKLLKVIIPTKMRLRGNTRFATFHLNSALGNCDQNDGFAAAASSSPSSLATASYSAFLNRAANSPEAQQIAAVTTHWNQVMNNGASMETDLFDMRILLRYTIDMETNQ